MGWSGSGRAGRRIHGRRLRASTDDRVRTGTCEDSRMDLGPVDRITTDAIGEPGLRTFYIQARSGPELVTIVVEKQQVDLLAASILELMANLDLETGTGPAEEELDLEQPFEPKWRAGKLSIGYDEGRDLFVLEAEEFR